jgi:hypothetical protein
MPLRVERRGARRGELRAGRAPLRAGRPRRISRSRRAASLSKRLRLRARVLAQRLHPLGLGQAHPAERRPRGASLLGAARVEAHRLGSALAVTRRRAPATLASGMSCITVTLSSGPLPRRVRGAPPASRLSRGGVGTRHVRGAPGLVDRRRAGLWPPRSPARARRPRRVASRRFSRIGAGDRGGLVGLRPARRRATPRGRRAGRGASTGP